MPGIKIRWGPNFSNGPLDINDDPYQTKSFDTFAGPTLELITADTWFDAPFDVRAKLKPRLFSAAINIKASNFSEGIVTGSDNLKAAFYNGPFRFAVYRDGRGWQYLTCRLSDFSEDGTGGFLVKFQAADPIWRACDVNCVPILNTISGDTEGPPYTVVHLPLYSGSAPALPQISLIAEEGGFVYRYYKEITITNPGSKTVNYYPICVDLGDIRSSVGTLFHEIGGGDHRIRDIRIESPGGTRKGIFIRDIGDKGGTWHQSVKVWTIIYSLAPGETKTLRLLYGNPTADPTEAFNEPGTTKPMFDMYQSDNGAWLFNDFMPSSQQSQTRTCQWHPYIPGATDLSWISFVHPSFDAPVPGNIPAAGSKVLATGPVSGAAGLQLTTPVGIGSVTFGYKYGSTAKTPFVLRSQRPDQRWVDDWSEARNKDTRRTIVGSYLAGSTAIHVDTITHGSSVIVAGDNVLITLDDGSFFRAGVASVNSGTLTVTLTAGLPSTCSDGNYMQQYITVGTAPTKNWTTNDAPTTIAFILRGDHPELNSGEWAFAGADSALVVLDISQAVIVSLGSQHDLNSLEEYQLQGQFGNTATGELMKIRTTISWYDKIVIDCDARTCMYYRTNGSGGYHAPVNRFERLVFESVHPLWVHIEPNLSTNNITFNDDSDSNFRNLHVTVTYPKCYF